MYCNQMAEVTSSGNSLLNALINERNNYNYNVYESLYVSSDDESESKNVKKTSTTKNKRNKNNVMNDNIVHADLDNEGWSEVTRKNDCQLKYDETTWQYKMINDLYIFKDDGTSVLDIFNLSNLNRKYNKAKNNYYRNKYVKRMMKTISNAGWENIKELVTEKYKVSR